MWLRLPSCPERLRRPSPVEIDQTNSSTVYETADDGGGWLRKAAKFSVYTAKHRLIKKEDEKGQVFRKL